MFAEETIRADTATHHRTPDPGLLLLANPASELASYWAAGGYSALVRGIGLGPHEVLAALKNAQLRGRGGASFAVATKWAAAAAGEAPRYMVCNGAEDEPGSRKDQLLMERHPHKVLEGLLLAAYAIGAEHAFVYINANFGAALAAMREAVLEARLAGLLSLAGLGGGGGIEVTVVVAPPVYVAGEETAALEVIEGRPPRPRRKPPYPSQAGLWGHPTVVNNVETLAAVPGIVRHGPVWYRRLGTSESPGTVLITLTGAVKRTGVFEVPFGTTLRAMIDGLGGGVVGGGRVKAVWAGGPSTPYLAADALDTPFDYDALRAVGSAVGCGAVRVVAEGTCMVSELQHVASFFADSSCGQCGPCLQGTKKMATLVDAIRGGAGDQRTLEVLERLAARLPGMGICALINGAAAPVASAVRLFRADFERHARGQACPVHGHVALASVR